jgi:CHAT domain-containing protein
LSACQTALGKDMGGEGLLGLTRAFLYAGAHSVLGSLWSVSDKSTALLMKRFYGYLKAGKSRDEALRAAQIDLIHTAAPGLASSAGPSSPFRWAAFQLSGDWR